MLKAILGEFFLPALFAGLLLTGSALANAGVDSCSAEGLSFQQCQEALAAMQAKADADLSVKTTLEVRVAQETEYRACMDMQLGTVGSLTYDQAVELKGSNADIKKAFDVFAPHCRARAGIKG